MGLKKRFQVFVSSTFVDLREERDEIANAIQAMGHIPAGMELFGSDADDSWKVIERTIDISDYFVLVLAGRYGSLSEEGVSFTEREFDYAKSQGIPVLAFVHENTDELPAGVVERTLKAQRLLKAFRNKVTSDHQVAFWNSKTDLCTKVLASLARTIGTTPRPGWVRGDVETELQTLRKEKSLLAQRVQHYEQEIRSRNVIIEASSRVPSSNDSLAVASIPVPLKWEWAEKESIFDSFVDIPSLGSWLFAFQMRTLSAYTFALAAFVVALHNQAKGETYRRYPCVGPNGVDLSLVAHNFKRCEVIPTAVLAEIATTAMAGSLLLADNPVPDAFHEYWRASPYGKQTSTFLAKIDGGCWATCARHYSNLPVDLRPALRPEMCKGWEGWAEGMSRR